MLTDLSDVEKMIEDGSLNLSNINNALVFLKSNDTETKEEKFRHIIQN